MKWLFFDAGPTIMNKQITYKHRMRDIANENHRGKCRTERGLEYRYTNQRNCKGCGDNQKSKYKTKCLFPAAEHINRSGDRRFVFD